MDNSLTYLHFYINNQPSKISSALSLPSVSRLDPVISRLESLLVDYFLVSSRLAYLRRDPMRRGLISRLPLYP